ncbi:putative reverse transcriptase domain-containing protein [Tanacetum coccineum]
MALELIKFVKQQLEELEDSNDDELTTSDHGEAERSKSKRLLGKGISNPLMAVMVCQKPYGIQLTNVSSTERVNTPGSDENRLKLYDLMYKIVKVADTRVKDCNFHHIGQCAEKYGNYKRRGHQARDCRIPVPRAKQRSVVSGKKAEVICYGCGGLGHYKSNCLIVKFQNRVNMYWKGKARRDFSVATSNINI